MSKFKDGRVHYRNPRLKGLTPRPPWFDDVVTQVMLIFDICLNPEDTFFPLLDSIIVSL